MSNIKGCKVAILATDGFEQVELTAAGGRDGDCGFAEGRQDPRHEPC
jgi:hypothetical protein